jgi:hypothetical protein
VPLPIALLAGMGFVAFFLELLIRLSPARYGNGTLWNRKWLFIGLACFIAYLASGSVGIYHSQIVKD